jgi:hypothetical protein
MIEKSTESLQSLTDDQIVTERKLPRRSFLSTTGAFLAGAAGVVSGLRAATIPNASQDTKRPDDPDKRPADPDKRPADPDKRPADPDRRPADPDKRPEHRDPDKKPADPDKRPADPDKPPPGRARS